MSVCLIVTGGFAFGGDEAEIAARVDALLEKSWTERKISSAKAADDAEYLRRTYLNIAGRIPAVSEAREFLRDESPVKRSKLVDQLLEGPGYVRHFANVWRGVYLPELMTAANPTVGPERFDAWVRDHLMRNSPYDEMVRELIEGAGVSDQTLRGGAGVFFQVKEGKPENIAAGITRSVLGIRLECAQCHDHPFAKWKQEEFWTQAAFFSDLQPGVPAGGEPTSPRAGELKIHGKDQVVQAKFLRGEKVDLSGNVPIRKLLAEWVTDSGNPYFAKATVNRVWSQMFGAGIVNPVDDLDDQNAVSQPEVLNLLSREFVAHKYDLKFLIRVIAGTRAYQLTSAGEGEINDGEAAFARMRVRPLSVDQLFDALSQATGYYEPFVEQGFFVETPRRRIQQVFQTESADGEARTSILQALALMNGEFVSEAVQVEKSQTLSAIVEAPFLDVREKVQSLYLATLSRMPSDEELQEGISGVETGGTASEKNERYGDLFWMLLNCSEFVLNH